MTVEVVCAGVPFLDVTFLGLDELPVLGQEKMAQRVELTAGGLANVALGLTRLEVSTAIVSPIGDDAAGRLLHELVTREGITWSGPRAGSTAISAVLSLQGDRAFASFDPRPPVDSAAIAALDPRAVVIDLYAIEHAPATAAVYAVCGDADARELEGNLPGGLGQLTALLVNASEACILSGKDTPESAAQSLSASGCTAVVTLGGQGALLAGGGELVRVDAPVVDVVDANGAGDLFTAAYVWADLRGGSPRECLRLAAAYASNSVSRATTRAGALALQQFLSLEDPIQENGVRL